MGLRSGRLRSSPSLRLDRLGRTADARRCIPLLADKEQCRCDSGLIKILKLHFFGHCIISLLSLIWSHCAICARERSRNKSSNPTMQFPAQLFPFSTFRHVTPPRSPASDHPANPRRKSDAKRALPHKPLFRGNRSPGLVSLAAALWRGSDQRPHAIRNARRVSAPGGLCEATGSSSISVEFARKGAGEDGGARGEGIGEDGECHGAGVESERLNLGQVRRFRCSFR